MSYFEDIQKIGRALRDMSCGGDVVIIDGVSSHRAIYPGHHKSNMLQAIREREIRRLEEYRQHMADKFEDENNMK